MPKGKKRNYQSKAPSLGAAIALGVVLALLVLVLVFIVFKHATYEPAAQPENTPGLVGPDSPEESIRFVQQMLSTVGLLTDAQVTGNYGAETENAIRAFQQFVNQQIGDGTVVVTGQADSLTLQYLEQYSDMGVQVAPSASPTASRCRSRWCRC